MIYATIHWQGVPGSVFTGETGSGTTPLQFFDAADADEFMRKLDCAYPGQTHTWKPVDRP